jgi:SAM-dependent methyltransferase
MLTDAFVTLLRFPGMRKRLWHRWYDFLARRYRDSDWTFMNYGFQDASVGYLKLEPADENDRSCIQLYNHVAGAVDLSNRRVLEVGSGRGGGCSFVARYLKPARVTGVDLAERAIAFCKNRYRIHGLDFQTGDAENLPFADAAFDAVVNVESSHCYPDLGQFFREVLRSDGHFLYADLHERGTLNEWRDSLRASGLRIIRETDITPAVVRALDQDNERKSAVIDRLVPRVFRSSFYDFAGIRGSKIDRGFRSGSLAYFSFVAEK